MPLTNEYWEDVSFWEEKNKGTPQPLKKKSDASYWEDISFWETPSKIYEPSTPTPAAAVMEASLLKTPEAKIKIYAKARNLPEEAYRLVDDEIVFEKNGKLYREKAKYALPRRIALETVSDPSVLGATAAGLGASLLTGGLALPAAIGGVIGGVGGEYGRQVIAEKLYGEKVPSQEQIRGLGTTALAGTAAEAIGYGITKIPKGLLSLAKGLFGKGKSTAFATRELAKRGLLDSANIQQIGAVEQQARNIGIKLNLLESFDNPVKTGFLRKVAIDEKEAGKAVARGEYIQESIPGFVKTIFPKWKQLSNIEKITISRPIRQAAFKEIRDLETAARRIVDPLYVAAYRTNPEISTQFVLDYIDGLIKTTIPSKAKKLTALKSDLVKTVRKKPIPIMGLEQVDTFKRRLSDYLDSPNPSSFEKSILSEIRVIRKFLVDKMDELFPEYRIARATHALLQEGQPKIPFAKTSGLAPAEIEKLARMGDKYIGTKGTYQAIAELSDKELSAIGTYVLGSSKSNPSLVKGLREATLQQPNGEQAWQQAFGDYVNFEATSIPIPEEGPINFGLKLWKSLMGTEYKKSMIKNALSDTQYKAFANLMDILRRTGIVFKRVPPSPGTPKDIVPKTVEAGVRSLRPLRTAESVVADKLLGEVKEGNIKSLLNIIYSDDIAKTLSTMNMKQDTAILLDILGRLVGWTTVEQTLD